MLFACQGMGPRQEEAFSAIEADETVYFTGTEPFWGGQVGGDQALWKTPDIIDGVRFRVSRFAGNNGVSFSGDLEGRSFDMTVTPAECSDGMSDRSYPYVATVRLGEERYSGCAWTDAQTYTGPRTE